MAVADAEAELVQRFREKATADPVWTIKELFGSTLPPVNEDIVRSVWANSRTAVKKCHASGGTYTMARICLGYLFTWPGSKVITTAPTAIQMEKLLWGEIGQAYQDAERRGWPLGGRLLNTELKISPDWFALGLSTDEGVRFQGFHGWKMLYAVDEAPGVRPDIWEAIEGGRAGGDVHVFVQGQPTVTSGPFFDAFHRERAGWATHTISAFDTPNMRGLTLNRLLDLSEDELDANEWPQLITRRWVKEKYNDWGPDSDLFKVRVMGQFPEQSASSLISLTWVEFCSQQRLARGGVLEAGLDPAEFGDDATALYLREGGNKIGEWAWQGADTMRTCGMVSQHLAQYKRDVVIKVDRIGIGAGVADRLKEEGWHVVDVVSSNSAPFSYSGLRFENIRAKYYWDLREQLRMGQIGGPIHDQTQAELVSIQYKPRSDGKIQLESKQDMRKRGVPSPNRADAMMLAHAPAQGGRTGPVRRVITLG